MGRFPFALVKKSLSLQPAPPVPEGLVPAGVLAPLFCLGKEPHLLFTKRTMMVKDHRGQISFPGGVRDAFDADLMVTALRETQEEIGLDPQAVEVLGSLKPITTITGYWVTAFVGRIPYPYEFQPNPQEVERLLILPLEGFCAPGCWNSGEYNYRGKTTQVCCWRHDDTVIWGATARIVLNLLARLGEFPIPGDHYATCLD